MERPRIAVQVGQDEYRDYVVLTGRTATIPRTKVLNSLVRKVVRKGKEEEFEDEDGKDCYLLYLQLDRAVTAWTSHSWTMTSPHNDKYMYPHLYPLVSQIGLSWP